MSRNVFVLLLSLFAFCLSAIPSDWEVMSRQGNLLYSPKEPELHLQPYVGNGYLATQIGSGAIFISGLFNGPADSEYNPSHRARIPSLVNINLANVNVSNVYETHYALDMKRGMYLRRYVFKQPQLRDFYVEQRIFAHRLIRNTIVNEWHVIQRLSSESEQNKVNSPPVTLCFEQNIGGKTLDINFQKKSQKNIRLNKLMKNEATAELWEGETMVPETDTCKTSKVYAAFLNHLNTDHNIDLNEGGKWEFCVPIQEKIPFIYLASFITDIFEETASPDTILDTFENCMSDARKSSGKYGREGEVSVLLETHWDRMEQEFGPFGIEMILSQSLQNAADSLTNLERLSMAVNASQYYIQSSIRDDWDFSLSPGSLSSNDYNGHQFWDTETWMYPALLMFHPKKALSMLRYRLKRIAEARKKAQSYTKLGAHYKGAMYPWESAFTGAETCPTVAPTGLWEHHISGDIAFALEQFWNLHSKNTELWTPQLQREFFNMAYEICEFHASRVSKRTRPIDPRIPNPRPYYYDIDYVIPPDEYQVGVNNSVYQAAIVQKTFDFVFRLAETKYKDVTIPSQWKDIRDGLYIPYDFENKRHMEFEGFKGDKVKQGDVILLSFPLLWSDVNKYSPDTRRNNLDYYNTITDWVYGPAMTSSMFSIGYLEEGHLGLAQEYFEKGYKDNMHEPFLVWSEIPAGGAVNFITGAGGFLQSLIFGYGGLRVNQDHLSFFAPQLPKQLSVLRLHGLCYQDSIFDYTFDGKMIQISMKQVGKVGLWLVDARGKETPLTTISSFTIPKQSFKIITKNF